MCDSFWEPLVEIYIVEREQVNDRNAYYRCLCSRVTFGSAGICTSLASEDDSEEDGINGDSVEEMLDVYDESMIETQSLEKHDEEPVSCYCSASHTDNNYSTDEHDSVRDSAHRSTAYSLTQRMGLHQSDSGADLSEYHDQHEEKSMQYPSMPREETFQVAETEIGNDHKNANASTEQMEYKHLSDDYENGEVARSNLCGTKDESYTEDLTLFVSDNQESTAQNLSEDTTHDEDDGTFMQCDFDTYAYPYSAYNESNKSAIDIAWEQYWTKNGEQLIWTSWIEKYANYINPDYFQNNINGEEKSQNAEVIQAAVEKFYEHNGYFQNQINENCELTHSNLTNNFDKDNVNDDQLQPATSSNNLLFDQCKKEENIDDAFKNESYLTPLDGVSANAWCLLGAEERESYNQYSNTENERLITRCDSINGSIAKTNVTSDSMTNVTKMTLSSSSYNSNSSSLATSFESPSHGSDTTNSASDSEEVELCENDKYWQRLWREHFESKYREEYERFVLHFTKTHSTDQTPDQYRSHTSNRSEEPVVERVSLSSSRGVSSSSKHTRSSRSEKHRKKVLIVKSVGALLNNLSLSNTSSSSLRDDTSEENPGDMAYITPQRSYHIKRGLKQLKEGLSLIDFHFEEEDRQKWHAEIVFRKRNIIWKPFHRRTRVIGNNMPEVNGTNETPQQPQMASENVSSSETDKSSDSSGSIPASPSLDRRCDQESWLGDESDWDDEDHIALHKITELDSNIEGDAIQLREQRRSKRQTDGNFHLAPPDIRGDPEMRKYWLNRYELFSKYDEGVQMDKESWYSVTPERIARHIAQRCRCDTIIDGFCGAGGNAIQFAFTCKEVIAVDIDPCKIAMARHNARIYGVEHKIRFICGDYFEVVPQLKANIVYLSPPWGGPSYLRSRVFHLKDILPRDGITVFNVARQVTEDVAYFLPKNVNIKELLLLAGKGNTVETEQYMEGEKHVALTCYFGSLATQHEENGT